jgi:hypothetical protein
MSREVTHLQIAGIWIDCSISEQHSSQAEVSRHPVEDGADVTDHVRLQPDSLSIEGLVTNQPIEVPKSHANGAVGSESGARLLGRDGSALTRLEPLGTRSQTIFGEPTLGALGLITPVAQGAALLAGIGLDLRPRRAFQYLSPRLQPRTIAWQANALRFDREFDRVRAVHDALRTAYEARRPVQVVTGLRVYESVVLVDLSVQRDASSSGSLRFGATGQIIRIVKSQTGQVGKPDPTQPRAAPKVDKGNQNTTAVPPSEVPPKSKSAGAAAVDAIAAALKGL